MQKLQTIAKQFLPQTLLLGCILVVFAPVVFLQVSLKYDMIDISLPWRYFIAECLQNNVLPFWNPFINYGFPQVSENQTWYPLALVLQWLSRYTLTDLHVEFVFHLVVASWGMYALLNAHFTTQKWAFVLAIVYTFSGFMVGNAQHFGWIISAAWLPWIWWSFLNIIQQKSRFELVLPLALYFMLTGGYPAFFVINAYLLLVVFGLWVFSPETKERATVLKPLIFAATLFFVMAVGVIFAVFEIADYITRAQPLTWEKLTIGSLSYAGLISAFASFIVTTQPDLWNVLDYGMANIFIGSTTLMVFVFSATKKTFKSSYFLIAIFMLMMALGNNFFVLKPLVQLAPFLNLFRFPALYKLFFIFFFLLALATQLKQLNSSGLFNTLKYLALGYILVGGLAFVLMDKPSFLNGFPFSGFANWTLTHRIFIWFTFIGFLWLALAYVFRLSANQAIIIGIIAESFLHVLLLGPIQIYYLESPKEANQHLGKPSLEFVEQDVSNPVKNYYEAQLPQTSFLWRNKSHYTKILAPDGYSPYTFKVLDSLNQQTVFNDLLTQPFFFFKSHQSSIRVLDFKPNKISLAVNSVKHDTLVFQQNFYPGWQAEINNQPILISKAYGAFMQIPIPQGNHQISWQFKRPFLSAYFIFSTFFSLFIGALIIGFFCKSVMKHSFTNQH